MAVAHCQIINSTGAPPVDDQTLLIDGGEDCGDPAGERAWCQRAIASSTKAAPTAMPGNMGCTNHLGYLQRPEH